MSKENVPIVRPQNYEKGFRWQQEREGEIRRIAYLLSLRSPNSNPETIWLQAEKNWEESQKLPPDVFIGG